MAFDFNVLEKQVTDLRKLTEKLSQEMVAGFTSFAPKDFARKSDMQEIVQSLQRQLSPTERSHERSLKVGREVNSHTLRAFENRINDRMDKIKGVSAAENLN